ncbi:ABC transporter ATP-binding protein [Dactylosporangium roseum]|uniref:ABC transporter ATP-binding protein n=1 Tax=Dactylosporangium roseum TaxID=47989 RepID=A0ABY5ZG93_9ACTN|nr:ABC transporter ATP-binding protein [Dactylosporangium roseum]UWZ39723.1 ABC transporter ATP-binding protein [Dactylosporangium roseum]
MRVENLQIQYRGQSAATVRGVSLELRPGHIMGLVGESGCGKSTLARTLMGMPPEGAEIVDGRILLDGVDLLRLNPADLRAYWGMRIAYISQDPSSALNPTRTVRKQILDTLTWHGRSRGAERAQRLGETLAMVGFTEAEKNLLDRFPSQLSGGQRQRLALATALACNPQVLILDEPTTGLDVSTQARLVALLKAAISATQTAVLWVSHDLALMNEVGSEIAVMYAGQVVERGPAKLVCAKARHPYTRALLAATPNVRTSALSKGIRGQVPDPFHAEGCGFRDRCDFAVVACDTGNISMYDITPKHEARCLRLDEIEEGNRDDVDASPGRGLVRPTVDTPVLRAKNLVVAYRGARTRALDDVSLELWPGEILGVVGESGSGKSTLLRALGGFTPVDSGEVRLDGVTLAPRIEKRSRKHRRRVQMIFQHADQALNPRHTVREILGRARYVTTQSRDVQTDVTELLHRVRLSASLLDRYSGELSGGQRQRLAIARALAVDPEVLLCDEITSALDVSVQAAILNLVRDLVDGQGLSAIFVSHNLGAVRSICDRTAVMQQGQVVELNASDDVWDGPTHAYTKHLIEVTPLLT